MSNIQLIVSVIDNGGRIIAINDNGEVRCSDGVTMVDLSLSIASMALKKNDDETYEQVLPVTIVGQSPHYTYLSNILNKLKVDRKSVV